MEREKINLNENFKPLLAKEFRNNKPLTFKQNFEIKRHFNNSCISCEFSKISEIVNHPQNSFCTKFNETVAHFNDGCSFHKGMNRSKLKTSHLQYLLDNYIK